MTGFANDLLGGDVAVGGGAAVSPRRLVKNFVAGTGIQIEAVENQLTEQTDITFTVTAVPSSTILGSVWDPVRAVAASNIANLGAASVTQDGVTLVAGDRVLLTGQSTGSQNGIYVVGTVGGGVAPLTRATDADSSAEFTTGKQVRAQEGTTYAGQTFYLSTTGAITLGTTSLTFSLSSTLTRVLAAGNNVASGQSITFGPTPATSSAALRFSNGYTLDWRNSTNTGNIRGLVVDASNVVLLGDGTNATTRVTASTTLAWTIFGTDVVQVRSNRAELQSGMYVDWAAGTALLKRVGSTFVSYDGTTLALTGAVTMTSLSFGADPADTGEVRLSSGGAIYGEASPAGSDGRLLTFDSSEQCILGEDTNVTQVQIRALTEAALYAAGTKRGWATSSGFNVQTGAIGGHEVDIQEFTANGTWTKPAGARSVFVQVQGTGGGGGGGARVTSGNACSGGSGGGAGILIERWFNASELGSSETITIQAAGTGGAGATVDGTAGGNGGAGGHSQFGSIIRAPGGGGGAGGQLAAHSGGGGSAGAWFNGTGGSATGTAGGTAGSIGGAAGSSGTNGAAVATYGAGGSGSGGANGAAGNFGGLAVSGPGGGSSGGGISVAPAAFNGGAGTPAGQSAIGGGGGAAGVAPGGAGGNGTTPKGPAGNAGGGGASNTAGAGGAGGTSTRGAGGAGAGSAIGGNGGAGAAGGDGFIRVITLLS